MPRSAKLALAILAAGPLLGALLAAAADPVMTPSPEEPWRARLPAPSAADPAQPAVDPDLAWYRHPDSYAPSWLDEQVTDWAPDYPAWTYSDFADDLAPADGSDASVPAIEVPALAPATPAPAVDAPPDGLAPLY